VPGCSPSLPFGIPELLDATRDAACVLDAGCGSGRLTVALAAAGAEVTGFDTSTDALAAARDRAAAAGVSLTLVEADMNEPLPFPDAAFDASTSRLALMVADDPVVTLRELTRTLRPGGRVATALWSTLDRNPWFDDPRSAVREVLGADAAAFARAFGRLGDPDEAGEVHRAAGLVDVEARRLVEHAVRADAAEHWRLLSDENGHFRRVDARLDESSRAAVIAELARRLDRFRTGSRLALPRTLVLVTARVAG
jgi:SAM-dependent methyltransferase